MSASSHGGEPGRDLGRVPTEARVLIYGSCVSRDTFEFLPDGFRLLTYVARQSAISAKAPAEGVLARMKKLPSAFQNRMISGDVRGDLVSVVERHADEVDVLLIDLIDERGGVLPLGGGYVTKLSEMWGAGGREAAAGVPLLRFGTDEHFAAWSRSFAAVVDDLARLHLLDRAVVLKTPWAKLAPDGSRIPIPDWMLDPDVADALYARYFERVSELGLAVIELPDDLARSPLDHRWGPSPFHYTALAYEFLARRIQAFAAGVIGVDGANERDTEDGAAPGIRVSEPRFAGVPRRNTQAWGPAQVFGSVAQLAETTDVRDGLITVVTPDLPVDLLVENNHAATTIISLHAAVGQKPMDLPIFTGRSITEGLGVNRIFVSDASLGRDANLKLAWYLGTDTLELTTLLHQAIAALQRHFGGRHLVFFGMSGGGFASLNLSHTFPGSLAVPVNAQTRIADYHPPAWEAFMRACFGTEGEDAARAALTAHPRADQRSVYAQGFDNSVIYLQNSQDAHVTTQLNPWIEALPVRDRVHVLLRAWGRGHVPPTARDLRAFMQAVPEVDGDWEALAKRWGAVPAPALGLRQRVVGMS